MRYVERNLRQNEHVIAKAHVTYWAIVPILLRVLLLGGGLCALLFLGRDYLDDAMFSISDRVLWLDGSNFSIFLALAAAVVIISAAIEIIRLLCIQMVATDKKLIGKYGVIYVHSLDAYLEKIDNFTIEETILGRIFRYNTISVGTTSNTMKFKYISNAKQFKNAVMTCYDERLEELMRKQAGFISDVMPTPPASPFAPGGGPFDGFGGPAPRPEPPAPDAPVFPPFPELSEPDFVMDEAPVPGEDLPEKPEPAEAPENVPEPENAENAPVSEVPEIFAVPEDAESAEEPEDAEIAEAPEDPEIAAVSEDFETDSGSEEGPEEEEIPEPEAPAEPDEDEADAETKAPIEDDAAMYAVENEAIDPLYFASPSAADPFDDPFADLGEDLSDEPEIIADVKEEKKPEPLDDILNFREVTDDFDLTLNSNRRDPWSKR